MMDLLQDLPDDAWRANVPSTETTHPLPNETSRAMYNRLVTIADQHEIIKANVHNTTWTSLLTSMNPNSHVFLTKPFDFARMSPNELAGCIDNHASALTKDGNSQFEGVMIDNGASKSPAGIPAFIRYCAHTETIPTITKSNRCFRGIGNGTNRSCGITSIRMPIGSTLALEFNVELVDQDFPIMLGLEHHKLHKCSTDEVEDTFTHRPTNTTIPLRFREDTPGQGGYLFLEWPTSESFYSDSELKKLRHAFGHPTTKALIHILKKASFKKLPKSVRSKLEDIAKTCKACQTYQSEPSRFRVSLPIEKVMFNYEIEVDLTWIDGDPVLHTIDRGTRYSVAKFMKSESAEYTWDLIMEFWVTVFTGYP